MKVAYIFSTTNSQKILNTMIIPQLLEDRHGAEVAGMFFFFDNSFFLLEGTEMGENLQKIHEKYGTILMACDQCAIERGIEDKLVSGAAIGCFPNLYAILGSAGIDQVITL
ncbi:MAG: DsrE-related protein SaoD [Bacillota bacterium]|jgi:sulfur relay (sulfurtransferase) complex TusBCD TusD component (DsrE family)